MVKFDSDDQPLKSETLKLLKRGDVTIAEWKEFRGTTADLQALYPKLTDEVLDFVTQHALTNGYQSLLCDTLVPLLLERIKLARTPHWSSRRWMEFRRLTHGDQFFILSHESKVPRILTKLDELSMSNGNFYNAIDPDLRYHFIDSTEPVIKVIL
jgi:hypothetical protein